MAIYITGDTHGDFQRFGSKYFPQQKEMSRGDYVVIAGDFGGLWDGSQKDQYWLDWLNKKPFTTLFVDGNHENFDLLNTLPEKEWNGGRVHVVRPAIASSGAGMARLWRARYPMHCNIASLFATHRLAGSRPHHACGSRASRQSNCSIPPR